MRPNYGRRTFLIRFGKCSRVLELNNPPQILGILEVQRALLRGSVVGHLKRQPAASEHDVDVATGVFLIHNSLSDFLRP